MRSGPMRHEITIERRVDAQSSEGLVHGYSTVGLDLAAIRDLTGRELFAAQQVQSQVDSEVRMHWRPDVDETCRLVHVVDPDSPTIVSVYDIVAVMSDMKTGRRELVMMCVKRTAEGWRSGPEPVPDEGSEFRVDDPELRVDDQDWRVDSGE